MPSNHRGKPTIAFRPKDCDRPLIEVRAELSGLYKNEYISRCCIYNQICIVGTAPNIQRIVDSVKDMRDTMIELTRQLALPGEFSLTEEGYGYIKEDCIALAITVVDILNGAAYLFDKEVPEESNTAHLKDWVRGNKMVIESEKVHGSDKSHE